MKLKHKKRRIKRKYIYQSYLCLIQYHMCRTSLLLSKVYFQGNITSHISLEPDKIYRVSDVDIACYIHEKICTYEAVC